MSDEVKIFKPFEYVDEELKLSRETDYNQNLVKALSKDGTIKVELERDIIINRLAKEIYDTWTDGLRELLANEFRACRISKSHFNANPKVIIELDYDKGSLWIKGVDSLGITSQVFLEVLRVLGRSNNFDSHETGYFGMGFLSFMTLSDYCIVRTYARESEEKYAVICKHAQSFELLEKPEMDHYGTEVGVSFDKSKIQFKEVLKAINDYTKLQNIETTVQYTLNGKRTEFKIPRRTIQVIFREYCTKPLRYRWSHGYSEGETYDPKFVLTYSDDDLEVVALVTKDHYRFDNHIAYLNGMSIKSSFSYTSTQAYSYHSYNRFFDVLFVNIRNERTFKPMPNRSSLTDEAQKLLSERMIELYVKKVLDLLSDPEVRLDKKEISELMDRLSEIDVNFLGKLSEEQLRVYTQLSTEFRVYPSQRYTLKQIFASKVVAVKTFRKGLIRKVKKDYQNFSSLRIIHVSDFEGFAWLKDYGVDFYEDDPAELEDSVVALHTNHLTQNGFNYGDYIIKRTITETTLLGLAYTEASRRNVYLTKDKIADYFPAFYETPTEIKIGKITAGQLKTLKSLIPEEEFHLPKKLESQLKDRTFPTTEGRLTKEEILQHKGVVLSFHRQKVIEGITKPKLPSELRDNLIVGYDKDQDDVVRLALWLIHKNGNIQQDAQHNRSFNMQYELEHFSVYMSNTDDARKIKHSLFEVKVLHPKIFKLMKHLAEHTGTKSSDDFEEILEMAIGVSEGKKND